MAKIERKFKIDSLLVNKKFLEELNKIVDKVNPKNSLRTEITIFSEGETSTFQNVKDFTESRILPESIETLSITKRGNVKYILNEDKLILFFLNIHEDPDKTAYYTLTGYDDGKLATCQKKLNNLLNEYKNWYYWIFKLSFPEGTIQLAVSISFLVLIWNILPALPNPTTYGTIYKPILLLLGMIFFYFFNKLYKFIFPFFDFQVNKTKRSNWLISIAGIITLGLIVNLIWKIIELIFFK